MNKLRAVQIIVENGTLNSTYSVIDENGTLIAKNKRDTCYYEANPELKAHIDEIVDFVNNSRLEE